VIIKVVKGKDIHTEGISGKNKVQNVKTVVLVEGRSEKRWISVINCWLQAERRMDGR